LLCEDDIGLCVVARNGLCCTISALVILIQNGQQYQCLTAVCEVDYNMHVHCRKETQDGMKSDGEESGGKEGNRKDAFMRVWWKGRVCGEIAED
jgi:hypothetical protein